MNRDEALSFLNPSQGNQLGTPAQPESMSPDEKGPQLAPQSRATGMSQEDALAFLGVNQQQKLPTPDSAYLTSPIPAAQLPASDPNNLTSNYTQSVPQATPQPPQKISKQDALAFLGASPLEQTGKTINLEALPPEQRPPIPEISQAKPMGFMEQAGRFMSPLLGPTEAQKFEEAVPVVPELSEQQNVANALAGVVPENAQYQYKPYANRLEREQGIFTPFVETPQLQPSPTDTTAEAIGKGVFNVGAGLAGSFMSPGGVLLGGAPKELETAAEGIRQIGRGAAGLFAGQMLSEIPQQVKEAMNPNASLQERVQGGLGAVVGLGFGGLAGKHAIMGEKPPVVPEPEPKLNPSANPIVNQREAAINAAADAQAVVPEAPKPVEIAPVAPTAPAKDLTSLLTEQLFHEEGSPEHTAIQQQIDALTKPAEAPVAEAQPTEENAVQEQTTGEVGVRNAPAVGEGVGTENKPEVIATQGEEKPQEEVKEPNTLLDAKTPEEVDSYVKAERQRLSQMLPTNTSNESVNIRNKVDLGKRSKALGMEAAAKKRQLTGNLTAKEQAAKAKREGSNYIGKPVSVGGKNGTVIGNSFGRVKVRFSDGTESTHLPEKIEAPKEVGPEAAATTQIQAKEEPPKEEKITPEPTPDQMAKHDLAYVDPESLKLSEDVPNFKEGADPVTGVVAGEELKGKYDPEAAGIVHIWERLNGDREVISGRHRWQLALANKVPEILIKIHREANGFTKEDALVKDAQLNIKDEKGSVKDFAAYFRSDPITKEDAQQGGLLSRSKQKNGFSIGRYSEDDLYGLFRAGKISEAKAAAIAESAPNDPALQRAAISAAKGLTAEELPGYIALLKEKSKGSEEQTNLFGEDESFIKEAMRISKAASARANELSEQIRAVQGAARNPEAAAKLGVDVKDPQGLQKRIADLKEQREKYTKFWFHNDIKEELGIKKSLLPTIETTGEGNLFGEKEMPFSLAGEAEATTPETEPKREDKLTASFDFGEPKETKKPPQKPERFNQKYIDGIKPIAERMFASDPSYKDAYEKATGEKLTDKQAVDISVEVLQQAKESGQMMLINDAVNGADSDIRRAWDKIKETKLEKSSLETWADNTIKESKKRLNVGLDPEVLTAYAFKGAIKIARGVRDFSEWSKQMLADFGESVRPHLQDIWNQAKQIHSERDKYAPKEPTEQEAFAKKAADALLKGRGTPITQEEMQNILSRKFPGITSREASDLYASATGTPKPPAPYAGVAAEGQGEKISLKNESAEAETKALGLPELTQQDEQEMNAAMDRAKATSAEDPLAGQRLAESLIADPRRSLTGDESALLLKHKTDLFNSLNKMAEGLTEGSPEQRFEKGLAYDNASKAYHDLLQAIKDRGSEWGREGRWRQALLHQDYTFATQERLATAAKRKPLTSNEKTKLAEETKRLTEIDKEIAETQEKEANKQEQKKAEQEIKNAPEVDPYIQSLVDRIRKNVSSAADAARERIRQRRAEGRLFTGVDPTDIADYAIIGADHLLEGTTKFADWSSKMIGEFGDRIKPYLNDIFNKSKQYNEQQIDKESKGSKSVKKRVSKAASPEERIRKGQETRARNRLEQLKQEEERQNKGDFSKPVKKAPIEPSEETKRLRIEAQKIKDRIDERRANFEKANRPAFNKVLDAISALNRFNILSHVTVLEHLAGAAVENIVTRPVSSTLAQLFRFNKTLDAIRRKAVYEGGLSAKSELKGVFGIAKSAKDIWNKLLKGKTDIDWLYGGKNNYSPSFVRAVENIHGAMKEPVRQGIFSRSLQLRIDAAEKMGLDPTNDEVLYKTLASEAVNDANMDIFMGDNIITQGLRGLMSFFEKNKVSPRFGKFISALLDIAMPVMNVPTNIAIRKMRLAGGLLEAGTRIGIAAKEGKLANGAEALTAQEAEQIMRAFKYGTLGLAIGAYAWTHSNQFGGIINNVGPNAPENKDLKKGEMELGGLKIARPLGHGPVATYMNMVADARRMYDKSVRNNPNSKWSSLSEPAFFSMFVSGLGSMPPAQAATRFFSPFTTAGQKVGQILRDMLIPGAVQDVAAKMDTKSQPKDFIDMLEAEPIKRSPKTFEQEIMKGIPGLRQTLPISKPRGSHAGSSSSDLL